MGYLLSVFVVIAAILLFKQKRKIKKLDDEIDEALNDSISSNSKRLSEKRDFESKLKKLEDRLDSLSKMAETRRKSLDDSNKALMDKASEVTNREVQISKLIEIMSEGSWRKNNRIQKKGIWPNKEEIIEEIGAL